MQGRATLVEEYLDELPPDVIGEVARRVPPDLFIEQYEASRAHTRKG